MPGLRFMVQGVYEALGHSGYAVGRSATVKITDAARVALLAELREIRVLLPLNPKRLVSLGPSSSSRTMGSSRSDASGAKDGEAPMLENGACALHDGALAFHVEFGSGEPRINVSCVGDTVTQLVSRGIALAVAPRGVNVLCLGVTVTQLDSRGIALASAPRGVNVPCLGDTVT